MNRIFNCGYSGCKNILFLCVFRSSLYPDALSFFFLSSPMDIFLITFRQEGRKKGKDRNIDEREKH